MQTCSTRAGACTCQHVGPGTYRRAGCADLSTLCKHGSRCVGELNSCGMARDQRVWEWNACGQWAFCVRFRRVKHSPAGAEHARTPGSLSLSSSGGLCVVDASTLAPVNRPGISVTRKPRFYLSVSRIDGRDDSSFDQSGSWNCGRSAMAKETEGRCCRRQVAGLPELVFQSRRLLVETSPK